MAPGREQCLLLIARARRLNSPEKQPVSQISLSAQTNPVKINSREGDRGSLASGRNWVLGCPGVSEQPMSDAATREGAHNRAIAALRAGVALAPTAPTKAADQNEPSQSSKLHLGVGLEGGVFCDAEGDLWSTVWVSWLISRVLIGTPMALASKCQQKLPSNQKGRRWDLS